MDSTFHFTIFVNHLILVGYATHTIGSFPSRRQLGGTFWGCGERKDQATNLIGVGGRCSWRMVICWWVSWSRCRMVSAYSAGSSAAGEGLASEARPGGSIGSRLVAIIEAENPWGSWGIALRVSIIPRTLSTHALAEGPSSRRARSMLFKVRWLHSLMALPSG